MTALPAGLLHPFEVGTRWPVTSRFGVLRGNDPHDGVDLGCPAGTPLYGSGRVVRVDRVGDGQLEGNGNAVWVVRDGVRFAYLHLSRIDVAYGDEVHGVIGLSGATGRATGPHLHLACYRDADTSADRVLLDVGAVFCEPSWTVNSIG